LCYVDAGGENDPSYYKEGKLAYEVALAPKEEKTLLFLAACPGGGALPDPEEMTWTPASLRQAAERVWAAERRRVASASEE
jgi:hypothetical protein